jgi:asparagine synthase (glutamine-hydrolysing)
MFAFALWDRYERTLYLARDRMGQKPLYYGFNKGVLFFASELKALRASPLFEGRIDRGALSLFLRYNYIPAPYSIYEGIYKLPAASWIKLGQEDISGSRSPAPHQYWDLYAKAQEGLRGPLDDSDSELEI